MINCSVVVLTYGLSFRNTLGVSRCAVAPRAGSPDGCWASDPDVTSPAGVSASSGRCSANRSSAATSPRSIASVNSAAENVLVIDPSSYGVSTSGAGPVRPGPELPTPAQATESGVTSATARDRSPSIPPPTSHTRLASAGSPAVAEPMRWCWGANISPNASASTIATPTTTRRVRGGGTDVAGAVERSVRSGVDGSGSGGADAGIAGLDDMAGLLRDK